MYLCNDQSRISRPGIAALTTLLAVCIGGALAHAAKEDLRAVFGAHPGYLFNVTDERTKRDIEMVMLEKPKEDPKPSTKVIVDEKLTKEFQDQYRYRFGETQAEQIINNPSRFDEYTYYSTQNVSSDQYRVYQRQFGEYMVRRLVEYHFDNFVKNDPTIRPIYELKDKISNLDVQVKKGYKVKLKYNFAGPSFEANVENPYEVEARVQIMMNGIISKPRDIITTVSKQVTRLVRLEAVYKTTEQLEQLVASRRMSKHITASITGSTGQLPGNPAIYQNLILIGMSWTE